MRQTYYNMSRLHYVADGDGHCFTQIQPYPCTGYERTFLCILRVTMNLHSFVSLSTFFSLVGCGVFLLNALFPAWRELPPVSKQLFFKQQKTNVTSQTYSLCISCTDHLKTEQVNKFLNSCVRDVIQLTALTFTPWLIS